MPEGELERAVLKMQVLARRKLSPPKAKQKVQSNGVTRSGILVSARRWLSLRRLIRKEPREWLKRDRETWRKELLRQRKENHRVSQISKVVVLAGLKEVALGNIKRLVEETCKKNAMEMISQEVMDITSLSCEMSALDIVFAKGFHRVGKPRQVETWLCCGLH